MTTPRSVTHSDGTTFSDGTGYGPTDPYVCNAWRMHGLAKAIQQLAAGKRLTPMMNTALAGIVAEAEQLP